MASLVYITLLASVDIIDDIFNDFNCNNSNSAVGLTEVK